jgi:hypothetical protein
MEFIPVLVCEQKCSEVRVNFGCDSIVTEGASLLDLACLMKSPQSFAMSVVIYQLARCNMPRLESFKKVVTHFVAPRELQSF